jgi:hypothetical protein
MLYGYLYEQKWSEQRTPLRSPLRANQSYTLDKALFIRGALLCDYLIVG